MLVLGFNELLYVTFVKYRKTYKHSFASMLSVTDNTFMSSQEISEQDILSPLNHTSQPETADPNVKLQGTELNSEFVLAENGLSVPFSIVVVLSIITNFYSTVLSFFFFT